jgi:hypothetical protein
MQYQPGTIFVEAIVMGIDRAIITNMRDLKTKYDSGESMNFSPPMGILFP